MLGAKEKRERALGMSLGLKGDRGTSPKSALMRKPYRPGVKDSVNRVGPAFTPENRICGTADKQRLIRTWS